MELKKLKNKNILITLIAILVVMSVGFVVNSYYDGVDRSVPKNQNYSDAFGKLLNDEDLNVDGITYTRPDGITLGNQSWDGFKEKDTRVLVTNEGLEITKHDDTLDERLVEGIQFYQEVGGAIIPLGKTGADGKLIIPKGKLITGESNLIEGLKPEGTPKGLDTKKEFKAKSTPIFVDPKIRFLGEVTGNDTDSLPTYQKIAKSIFHGEAIDTDKINSSNIWLKYYTEFKNSEDKSDAQEKNQSQVYISKEPVIKGLTQEQMKKHNLFTGALIRANNKDNFYYKIRVLEGSKSVISKTADYKNDEVKEITQGSEWNNYILPLLKERKYNLANYDWNNTLNPNKKDNWVQNAKVRNNTEEIKDAETADYRAMLTKVPCYEQACFEGEINGTDFITYNELIATIEGETNPKEKEYKAGNSTKIGNVLSKGNDEATKGNWLKIYDAREGKTLYIAKKPLTNHVSWNDLCKAGVVFGLDQVHVDGTLQPHFKTPSNCGGTYKPKIITKNNKTYIVRLLKTTKENRPNENLTTNWNTFKTKTIMGSEWNRYILPLVKDYRYGSSTTGQLEDSLKQGGQAGYLEDKNFDIQSANYNWFGDLTLGTYSDNYRYRGNIKKITGYNGQYSWMQELTSISTRALRGNGITSYGAARADGNYPFNSNNDNGFRPVLEEIN
jgi:hypothetical protein